MYENFDIGHDLKTAFEDGYRAGVEAAQPKWISVEERLPDEPGEVLACVYGRICIAWYSNRCFETPSGMVFYACENAVTHWMPTPEPPKEGE